MILTDSAEANRGRGPLLLTTSSPRSFPGQFDLVVSHEVVYLLPDLARTFADIHASLARGGHFCLTTGCHTDNLLFPGWRASLATQGIVAQEYSMADYEAALRDAGFSHIQRDRLRLSPDEYEAWIRHRASAEPNPAWFPSSSVEKRYYTQVGKMVLTAQKG
jgi:SAM-dependent methyltransferase